MASPSLPSDTSGFLEEDPPFTTNKWVLETRITAGQAVNSALKGLQLGPPDHQDYHCWSPAKLPYLLSVEMLYSSQTVFHLRERSQCPVLKTLICQYTAQKGERHFGPMFYLLPVEQ